MIFIGINIGQTDDTGPVSASASASASAGTSTTTSVEWPINWPNCQGSLTPSNFNVTHSASAYQNELAYDDLILLQGLYPAASYLQKIKTGVDTMQAISSGCRFLLYQAPMWAETSSSNTLRALNAEIIGNFLATAEWYAYSPFGSALYAQNEGGNRYVNMADHLLPLKSGKSYYRAHAEHWKPLLSAHGALSSIVGPWYDSMDTKDSRPRYITSAGTQRTPDYNRDGTTAGDSKGVYRAGIAQWIDIVSDVWGSADYVGGNGGGDVLDYENPTDTMLPLSTMEWYQKWSTRANEWADRNLGVGTRFALYGSGDRTSYIVRFTRFERLWTSNLLSLAFCKPDAQTRLGKAYVMVDVTVAANGTTPYWQAHGPNDYQFMRSYWALCMLHPGMMFSPHHDNQEPTEHLDEARFRLGNPIGTWSIGSLNDSTGEFTARAADSNGVYMQEFNNGLVYWNSNAPTGGDAAWPQATQDVFTLPDPGAGKVWRKVDCTTYVNPKTGWAMRSQDPAFNSGAVLGATHSSIRYGGGLLERADA